MPGFNLGFNQRRFNGTTAVTRQAINMGTMRGKGSTSRMFNFCKTHSTNPSGCIDQFITITSGGSGSTVPGAPVITAINGADGELQVFFTAPSNGGSPITDYLYSINNGLSFTSYGLTSSPLTIVGLTNGQTYEVRIKAVNSVGQGSQSNVISATPVSASTWFYSVSSIPQNIGNWTGAFINSVGLDSTNAQFISIIYPTYQGTPVTPDPTYGTPRTVCYIGYDTSPLTSGNLTIQPIGLYPSFNGQFNFSYNYTLSDYYPTDAKISINSQNRFAIMYNSNNLQTDGIVLPTGGVMYGSNGSISENIIANRYQFPPTPLSFYTYVFTDVYCGYDNISGNEFIIWMGRAPNGSYASPSQNSTRLFIYKLGASVFREISLGIISPYLAPTVFQPYTSPTGGATCFACSNILETNPSQSFNCWPKTCIIGTGISGSLLNGYIYLYVNISSADNWIQYTQTRGYINPTATGGPNTDGKSITSIKMNGHGTKIYATTVDGLYYASSGDASYTNLTFTTIDDATNQYSSNGWSYTSWSSLGVSSPVNPQLSLSYDGIYLLVVFSSNDKPIRSGDGGNTWETVNNINGQPGWDSFSQGAVCSVNPSGINQSVGWSYGTGTVPGTFKSSAISNDYGIN